MTGVQRTRLAIVLSAFLLLAAFVAFGLSLDWDKRRRPLVTFEGAFVSGTLSVTSGTPAIAGSLSFNRDSGDYFDGSNYDRVQAPLAGTNWYAVTAQADWEELAADATLRLVLLKNGNDSLYCRDSGFNKGGHPAGSNIAPKQLQLAQNDYVQLQVYQNSGSALTCRVTLTLTPCPDPASLTVQEVSHAK